MKHLALALVFLLPIAAQAKDKPDLQYQDATLVDFHAIIVGHHCSTNGDSEGTVQATTTADPYGNTANTDGTVHATTTASTNCHDIQRGLYRLKVGEHVYSLEPAINPASTLPIAVLFRKQSVLYGLLPGTAVQVRSEGADGFYVKAGKRESKYRLVGAE